jgi:hypothetical protein
MWALGQSQPVAGANLKIKKSLIEGKANLLNFLILNVKQFKNLI